MKSDLYTRRKTRKKEKQDEDRENYVIEGLDLDKMRARSFKQNLDQI